MEFTIKAQKVVIGVGIGWGFEITVEALPEEIMETRDKMIETLKLEGYQIVDQYDVGYRTGYDEGYQKGILGEIDE